MNSSARRACVKTQSRRLLPLDHQRRLQAIVTYRTFVCYWHFYRQIYRHLHLIPKISIQHLSPTIETCRRSNARTLQDLSVLIAGNVFLTMQAFNIYRGLSAAPIQSKKIHATRRLRDHASAQGGAVSARFQWGASDRSPTSEPSRRWYSGAQQIPPG